MDEEGDDEWCDEEFLQLEEEEEEEETGEESEDTEQHLDENVTGIEGATPTPKRRRVTRDATLAASVSFGQYLQFLGMHGPSQDLNPKDSSPFSLSVWTLV